MGREIKYRAWIFGGLDEDAEPFVEEVSALKWDDSRGLEIHWTRHSEFSYENECYLMQYTGLKDRGGNGEELYAGDILKDASPRASLEREYPGRGIGVIVWSDYSAAWCLEWSGSDGEKHHPLLSEMLGRYSRKIGNVHQNPELLNG